MEKEELIEKFDEILSDTNLNENDIQRFLEEHSELIPLPFLLNHGLHFSSVISKLQISDSYKTDFAFLTKSSDYWHVVLIELEDPKKKLFSKKSDKFVFSADFNEGYDQVLSWKAWVDDHKEDVLKKFETIRMPLERNPVRFKYVLVVGRSAEKDTSDLKRRMFSQKSTDDILVITYDSLISELMYREDNPKNILSPSKEGFRLKKLNTTDTAIFAYLTPEYLKIEKEDLEVFRQDGFEMDLWLQGEFLTTNQKYTSRSFLERFGKGKI